jgi:hypothetical protein
LGEARVKRYQWLACVLALAGLACVPRAAAAWASEHPVIDSTSTKLKILDGDDELVGELAAGLDPDTYVVHPSSRPKRVSYVTDRGRLDFVVKPGDTYDFAIRFGGRLYNQRVATDDPHPPSYSGAAARSGGVDTLPFRLGPNNAIHLVGAINGIGPLDLIFDTGAGIGVLGEGASAKGAALHEGKGNRFTLGAVTIGGIGMKRIDFHGTLKADGVIGYDSFAGKVVEIDYDAGMLRIRHDLPRTTGYRHIGIVWRGDRTLVPMMINAGGRDRPIVALFDTGSKWSLTVSSADPVAPLVAALPRLGGRTSTKSDGSRVKLDVVTLPQVSIGGFGLAAVQADVERERAASNVPFNIVGNDFLKRFNAVIDYRTGDLFLKPNRLRGAPYNRVAPIGTIIAASGAAAAAAILTIALVLRRRRLRAANPALA